MTRLWLIVLICICLFGLAEGSQGKRFTLKPTTTKQATGFQCLRCDETVEPVFCDTITQCGSHEICYVETIVSAAGNIRYNMGCRDVLQCDQTHILGRRDMPGRSSSTSFQHSSGGSHNRRTGDLLVCSECCTGDLCNSAGCGSKGYPTPRGPICYNCPQQTTADDCSKITLCGQDEVCMLRKTADPVTHKGIYESKCKGEQLCNDELSKQTVPAGPLVGKRRKRDFPNDSCLMQCCKTSLCNINCKSNSSFTPPVTTQPTQVVVHWSDWTHWTVCSKSCGTGTSVRRRTCANPSTAGCTDPALTTETKSCFVQYCPGRPLPNDCLDIKHTYSGAPSQVYKIELWESMRHINVFCDMETDTGGWTILQHRCDGSHDFNQKFSLYTHGFGNLLEEFWLGLENLHEMLLNGRSELRIELRNKYSTYYETFPDFSISQGPNYSLQLSSGTGTGGQAFSDDMTHSNGAAFSTHDRLNINCAGSLNGGWWFTSCQQMQLNGDYHSIGMQNHNYQLGHLTASKMMFRRI